MLERDFQTKFSKWLKYNAPGSGAYELKLCKSTSLPYSDVQPHQLAALSIAKHGTLVHKISDFSPTSKPFDCFTLSHCPAYVVILFHRERGDKDFYLIDIDTFITHRDQSPRKSITKEEARLIACQIGTLA